MITIGQFTGEILIAIAVGISASILLGVFALGRHVYLYYRNSTKKENR